MKHAILLLFACLALCATGQATTLAAADSVRGQQKFVQLVTNDLCERLQAEQQRKPFTNISAADAKSLLVSLMQTSLLAHAEEMNALLTAGKGGNTRKVGEQLGTEVVTALVSQCPAGQQLMVGAVRDGLGSKLAVTEAEKPVLQVITRDICHRLDAENAKSPLAARPPAERKEAFSTAMQGSILANMEAVANFYGFKELQNSKTMEQAGQKIVLLMLDECPVYLLQFSMDEYLKGK